MLTFPTDLGAFVHRTVNGQRGDERLDIRNAGRDVTAMPHRVRGGGGPLAGCDVWADTCRSVRLEPLDRSIFVGLADYVPKPATDDGCEEPARITRPEPRRASCSREEPQAIGGSSLHNTGRRGLLEQHAQSLGARQVSRLNTRQPRSGVSRVPSPNPRQPAPVRLLVFGSGTELSTYGGG